MFCCVECRLLQAPATACIECGTQMIGPLPLVRELLGYRDTKIARGRDWARSNAPFVVETSEGPVLVAGPVRFIGANAHARVKTGDVRLERMGVPDDLALRGALETAHIGEAGRVRVVGVALDEAVAELAFHRDGGTVPAIRGAVGAPVLVSIAG